jgi:hypothetical protein
MSTKESKSDRVTRLFEHKVKLDDLDLDDLKFVSLHIQQAYIHTNLKGAKKAKGDSKPNAFFEFRAALASKVKELDLPHSATWLSQFAGYLYTNKNWKEDTDKLEDEDELTRLHERFAAKNPIPEKKAKAAPKKAAAADDSEDEAPKAKSKAKKVPVDSEDDEPVVRPGSAKRTDEEEVVEVKAKPTPKPKPAAKAAPKKVVKEESEDEVEVVEVKPTPKPKAKKAEVVVVEESDDEVVEVKPAPKAKAPAVRMTPEEGGEVQIIKGKEYYTAQVDGKLNVWTVKDGAGGDHVGIYNFKTKEIDTDEDME